MKEPKKLMQEYEKKLEQNVERLDAQYRALGAELSSRPKKSFKGTEIEAKLNDLAEINKDIKEKQDNVAYINKGADRLQEIGNILKDMDKQHGQAENNRSALFEDVGKEAYGVYKRQKVVSNTYRELFSDIVRLENELSALDGEINSGYGEGEKIPFYQKIMGTGKKALKQGSRRLKESALKKQYKLAGERICNEGLAGEFDSENLQQLLEKNKKEMDTIDSVKQRSTELTSERDTIVEELQGLDANKQSQKRIREIEEEKNELDKNRNEIFGEIGRIFYDSPVSDIKNQKEINGFIQEINRIQNENEELRENLNKLEAAVEIDAVNKQLSRLNEQVQSLEEKIETRKQELEHLKIEIKERKEKRQELEKVRGPVEHLLEVSKKEDSGNESQEETKEENTEEENPK